MTSKSKPLSNSKKLCTYPLIGEVSYICKSGLKRVSLRVNAYGDVRVSMPPFISFKYAEEFMLSNGEWIIEKKGRSFLGKNLIDNDSIHTRYHTITLFEDSQSTGIRVIQSNNQARIHYPLTMAKNDPAVREVLKKVVEHTYMKEAKDDLPLRTATLAAAHGFSFRRVSISRATTRWGSCSPENNIRLSLHLMRLPDHLVDYVIIHELCHTVEKNHGINFWKLMNEHCNGHARQLAREIKEYHAY